MTKAELVKALAGYADDSEVLVFMSRNDNDVETNFPIKRVACIEADGPENPEIITIDIDQDGWESDHD